MTDSELHTEIENWQEAGRTMAAEVNRLRARIKHLESSDVVDVLARVLEYADSHTPIHPWDNLIGDIRKAHASLTAGDGPASN